MKSCLAISWFVKPRASSEHLALALRERVLVGPPLRLGVGGDQPRAELGMDVSPARGDLADRRDDLRVGGLLQHVPARADRERLADVPRVVLHREDEDLQLGLLVEQLRYSFEPALARA